MADIFKFGGLDHGKKINQGLQEELAALKEKPEPLSEEALRAIEAADDAYIRDPKTQDRLLRYIEKMNEFAAATLPISEKLTEAAINIRRTGLKGHTLEQLESIVIASEGRQWQHNPLFYAAVISEVGDRRTRRETT